MKLSANDWKRYISKLSRINKTAAKQMQRYIDANGTDDNDALLGYAYALTTKYGEASGSLASEMYDAIAERSGVTIPPAEAASPASFSETAKAVNGTMLNQNNTVPQTVGRLVKQTAADTMLKNALRDGAKFAWIPSGDTCAFCITLASRGWQYMSKNALKNGHAEHIHANCDCEYAVSFDKNPQVEGYNPEEYLEIYQNAEGDSTRQKINAMRRQFYAQNKRLMNPESGKAEEFVFTPANKAIQDFEKKARTLKQERAIITDADGNVFATSQGGKRSVRISEPSEAGYIFSHNHPVPANFSVADVRNFEQVGYKQIRAVAPDKTYVLEAVNPKRLTGEGEDKFTTAMFKEWNRLDEESAKKRKAMTKRAYEIKDMRERGDFASKEMQKILDWRNKSEDEWLKKNAKKYGYRYKAIPSK